MPLYRFTYWHLSATAGAVMGWEGIERRITEVEAESPEMAKAILSDQVCRSVDDEIWFGSLTEKEK